MRFLRISLFVVALAAIAACGTTKGTSARSSENNRRQEKAEITSIAYSRIIVDDRYDAYRDSSAEKFLKPYTDSIATLLAEKVGEMERSLDNERPESEMGNLVADIFVWMADDVVGDTVDFAVVNLGGLRTEFERGPVTFGNVLRVAPFENFFVVLTLKGEYVQQLFQQIASRGGEGVSSEVRLVVDSDDSRQLVAATIGSKPVSPERQYRIATIDYLAQGGDDMSAFSHKTDYVEPTSRSLIMREVIASYFRYMSEQGHKVDARREGRLALQI